MPAPPHGPDDGLADALACAADAAAGRIRDGATVWCVAPDHPSHARHVAVEFVHPVIVGKVAVPAVAVGERDPAAVVRADVEASDVVVLVGPATDALVDVAARSTGRGLTTIWIGIGPEPGGPEQSVQTCRGSTPGDREPAVHRVWLDTDPASSALHDGRAVRAYHLLWELTHLRLEHGAVSAESSDGPGGASDFLYPFLSADTDGSPPDELHATLVASAQRKMAESDAVRSSTLADHEGMIEAASSAIADRFRAGGRLFAFGNGGSATDASGMASLFAAPPTGGGLPARCLSEDVAVISALANDIGVDGIFSRQVRAFVRPTDVVVGFSTSGASVNVVDGLVAAHEIGALTIGLAGHDGGLMADHDAIDHGVVVRVDSVHRVQEAQAAVAHALWRRVVEASDVGG